MAERIVYGDDGSASIRNILCDMGNDSMLHISVESDGDITFDLWDGKGKQRLGEIEINNGASRTRGLAAVLAPVLREYARKNKSQ